MTLLLDVKDVKRPSGTRTAIDVLESWDDLGPCAACRACEVVCSFHHTGQCDPAASSIRIALNRSNGSLRITLLATCDRCAGEADGPLCVRSCALGALTKEHILGISQPKDEGQEL